MSYFQKGVFCVKRQKKPQKSPKGLVKFFYLWCLLITHMVVWAGVIVIARVHFINEPDAAKAHCEYHIRLVPSVPLVSYRVFFLQNIEIHFSNEFN